MRYFIKILICRVLFYSGLLDLYIRFLLQRRKDFTAVIINYHSFVDRLDKAMELDPCVTHRIDDFRKEVRFLKKYFDISSLDRLVEGLKRGELFKRPTVAITIDDGYKNNYDYLFPAIKESQIPVTIFLTTDYIGTNDKIWVDRLGSTFYATSEQFMELTGEVITGKLSLMTLAEKRRAYMMTLSQLKDLPIESRDAYLAEIERKLGKPVSFNKPDMLNWQQVREMLNNHVSFGAHTCSHPILTSVPVRLAKEEISNSKKTIEEKLGVPVKHFAYPNGRPQDFNEELRAYCREIGFESVSTCDYGANSRPGDVFALKRIGPPVPISLFAVNLIRAFDGS
ncbi:MAG TPA: hypothetical protein DD723_01810 [Candidatus Omnitrophica bacterium]|nr:MAG: hypothetical protein A2Z81_08850 [Omnitrophica WOR_2 bacterium GWA2_45_18]OGX19771.1 MAG: hypothetical protein A2Y04_05960 [Omnitrophica WOR_2 bacterium GWC2_45_7]HBR14262.1 hypothetical protein [Candidatus Omnitrophota bacterium]